MGRQKISMVPVWNHIQKHSSKYTYIDRPSLSTMRMGKWDPGIPYYEIVTPTVAQVARNHYNCDRMVGMRLENQPTSNGKP